MLAPITHFIPAAEIRRERLTPAGGRIIARRGQQVNPIDVVAELILRPEHLLLDIGRGLGLAPKDADHYIQRRAGDEVGEGDVIAGPVGIGRRVVRTPKSGTVVVAGGGQVLLELEGEFTELKAGYSGVIADIIGDRGGHRFGRLADSGGLGKWQDQLWVIEPPVTCSRRNGFPWYDGY